MSYIIGYLLVANTEKAQLRALFLRKLLFLVLFDVLFIIFEHLPIFKRVQFLISEPGGFSLAVGLSVGGKLS